MNFNDNYKDLFIYKINKLKKNLDALDRGEWDKNKFRQLTFKVHENTKSLIFAWSNGDFKNVDIKIKEEDLGQLSKEVWKIANKLKEGYKEGSKVINLMLANLPAGKNVHPHTDGGNLSKVHRCHLVIKTNEKCMFGLGDGVYNFKEGQAIEINNQRPHYVNNEGDCDRVHLICDILES